ncbi:hypothetical protein B0H17DRAFT_1197973 [Mycena rosella]|uniref:Uncharacterized protein n=1 Tax=Mycena rosella TaxID=1033263 RepID=A0AAD7DS47_MYCRO|nr:hypothetical protein B0H17DRAFT_1197973 [Mycena rosella]
MFKAGDPKNPFDPASMDLSKLTDLDLDLSQLMAHLPFDVAEFFKNPANVEFFNQHQRERAAERARSGETQWEVMMREKREWAKIDATSRKLKEEGNVAFRKGDLKMAYVIYTVCMELSPHEPLYPLNRSAVALKLKLYELAIKDASNIVLERGNFKCAKVHFRRGQGWCFLGDWAKADEEALGHMTEARGCLGDLERLKHQHDEHNILREIDELKRLRGLSSADRAAWTTAHVQGTLLDVFEPGELEWRTAEVRKRSVD